MNGLTMACVFAAWTVTALTVAGVWARRAWRAETEREQPTREATQHDVGPDSLRLLQDLDAHLDAYAATVADYYDTTTGGTQ